MREVTIDTEGGPIFGMASGHADSELVLAVHGWSKRNGWHTWAPLLQPLGEAGFYAVSVDLPGWGRSTAWTDGPVDVDQGVKALELIIAGLGKTRASLAGKSWGGGIALELALRKPSLVDKLILSAPAFRSFGRLRELSNPVLLVWSMDDPVIPYENASSFTELIPTIQLVTYESGGHSAGPMNADDFAPLVTAFLKDAASDNEAH